MTLERNKLNKINANTFNGLQNLKNLDLYGNKFIFIDKDAFKCLGNLKKITYSDCQRKFFDSILFENKSIEKLAWF